MAEEKRVSESASQSAAAISLVFITVVTPWAVQQVITSCTKTIVSGFPCIYYLISLGRYSFIRPQFVSVSQGL